VRFVALSFFRMLRTCTLTVRSCMSNRTAISLLGLPSQKFDYRKLTWREVPSIRSSLRTTGFLALGSLRSQLALMSHRAAALPLPVARSKRSAGS
jgi:hypothetical protein